MLLLLKALKVNRSLTWVVLRGNKIGAEGAKAVAEALKDWESTEVRESTRVALGDADKRGWCGVLLTLLTISGNLPP